MCNSYMYEVTKWKTRELGYILAELQIREGIEDNSGIIFSYFSTKIYMYVVVPH